MIVSRSAELDRLDEVLGGVRAGAGRALVVHGDPGIGKTTLLEALVERCGDDVTVLRASGVETEAELAFAALCDLVGPIAERRRELPAPQSSALAAALALGPPAPGDRLAVCVATLELLRAAGPVVAVVDDVQWIDAASRECVLYAARRAGGPVAVVMAARDPWDRRAQLPELELGPLPGGGALELLRRRAPDLSPPVASAVADAAGGNPLALVELPASLTPEERSGVAPLELPLDPGGRLRRAFASRIDELDPAARRALLVAAAHPGADLMAIAAACGPEVERLAQAEARGLVRIGAGELRFAHPIIRGAAYHSATPAERRAAHAALAGVVGGERRAWHRAAAAVGPDEEVAGELETVAACAAARRGFAAAAAAYERAARLSPHADAAARRVLAAGEAAAAAGARDRALALLEEAARDDALRARAQHQRGRIMVWSGSPIEAVHLLVRESGRNPALTPAMLADAANGCTVTNSFHRAEELARRAVELYDGDPAARGPLLAMLGWALLLRGKAPEAEPVLREAERLAEGLDPLGLHGPWQHLLLLSRLPLGELERARAESLAVCERARQAGALATLGSTLIVLAEAAYRLGDWATADDAVAEAVRVTGDTGQHTWHGYALTLGTRLAGARGECEAGREAAAASLAIVAANDIPSGLRFVHGALGFLELSVDRVDEAIAELEVVERLVAGSGHEDPTLVPFASDLVEAHVRAGRLADAERLAAVVERQAATSGTAFAGAVAGRSRGMLADDFEPAFAHALACDRRRPMPFERARTLLALGRRLHRARRRAEARERLRDALAGFQRLGATAWAAQAQNELRAAGGRRRPASEGALTPQEQRVAAAVARGASNREIAAELFLAPKTVEFHLRQIYRKLGIRGRTQLVATLATRGDATEDLPAGRPRTP
jgi:DNA-binding CsgD family transcriptional regulator